MCAAALTLHISASEVRRWRLPMNCSCTGWCRVSADTFGADVERVFHTIYQLMPRTNVLTANSTPTDRKAACTAPELDCAREAARFNTLSSKTGGSRRSRLVLDFRAVSIPPWWPFWLPVHSAENVYGPLHAIALLTLASMEHGLFRCPEPRYQPQDIRNYDGRTVVAGVSANERCARRQHHGPQPVVWYDWSEEAGLVAVPATAPKRCWGIYDAR